MRWDAPPKGFILQVGSSHWQARIRDRLLLLTLASAPYSSSALSDSGCNRTGREQGQDGPRGPLESRFCPRAPISGEKWLLEGLACLTGTPFSWESARGYSCLAGWCPAGRTVPGSISAARGHSRVLADRRLSPSPGKEGKAQ